MRLVPPPAVPIDARGDWDVVGLALPSDYRALVERYGRGEFNDLWSVFPPFGPDTLTDQIAVLEVDRDVRRDWPADYPYPLYPEPGGLLIWGAGSDGHRLCWLTEGRPDEWPVVVWHVRDGDYELRRAGAAEVLASLVADNGGVRPWFDQPRELTHVYVRLDEGRHSYRKRLKILKDALAPIVDRGGLKGVQDHFLATPARWRVTYDNGYGHQIRIAFAPADEQRAREAVARAADLMGCAIKSTRRIDGTPVWGSAS